MQTKPLATAIYSSCCKQQIADRQSQTRCLNLRIAI